LADWLEILLLAVASSFWPTLILVVVVALRLEHPTRILAFFVSAGLLTTITIGIVIVHGLEGTSVATGSSHSVTARVYLAAGALSLLAAAALYRSSRRPRQPRGPSKPSLAERSVEHGAAVAFGAGIVLNVFPGTFPFVAMVDIAQLDTGAGGKFAAVVLFYLVMFAFAEVPIVAYLFAPERTIAAMTRFNDWLTRNGRLAAAIALAVVGAYLMARGFVRLD
jgi:Sap, sulfolipid-1-addressing protein